MDEPSASLSSLPVDGAALNIVAEGLGHAGLLPERVAVLSNARPKLGADKPRSPSQAASTLQPQSGAPRFQAKDRLRWSIWKNRGSSAVPKPRRSM